MVTQISVALSSLNFYSWKSYFLKIGIYFLAICANSPCKIEKSELSVVDVGILGDRILLSRRLLTYLIKKLKLKE